MAENRSSSCSIHIRSAESMTSFCGEGYRIGLRRRACCRAAILRRCVRRLLDRCILCSSSKSSRYRVASIPSLPSPSPAAYDGDGFESEIAVPTGHNFGKDSDLVVLKISVLGDSEIGKTSFLEKYVGNEIEKMGTKSRGLNLMDKTLMVGGARLSYSLWEVGGDKRSEHHIPVACKDSVAIFFMFDLTSRCTLNSVMRWYHQARKWNQTGIPILIGSKYDDFIQLPIDLQRTIASQARAYARAINATLFFSSAAYNINVNKIFKFITAKLFDLPWTVERNLNIGEPIIDY